METEKYDLEERGKRQGHDVRASSQIESKILSNFHNFQLKVLNERQIQRLRLKAVRMGLHAE